MSAHFVSNKRVTPRLFDREWMERLSHVHPVTPAVIFLPVMVVCAVVGVRGTTLGLTHNIALFLGGMLVWTLTEYAIHRWVFHAHPTHPWLKRVHFLMHGVHHDYPRDPKRLVMPPVVSVPLTLIFFAAFHGVLGFDSWVFFAGFILGYVIYDTLHYAVHHMSLSGSWIALYLQQYHARHHYLNSQRGFGVSSPLWDWVFGTYLYPAGRTPSE